MTHHRKGILNLYLKLIKKKTESLSACNRLDLETLGSQPIMPEISRDIDPPLNLASLWATESFNNSLNHGKRAPNLKEVENCFCQILVDSLGNALGGY